MKLYIKDGVIKSADKIQVRKVIKGKTFVVYGPNEKSVIEDGWIVYNPPAPTLIEPAQENQYKQRVIDLIRERYSINDELAILRQRDNKVEEFNEYNQFVENVKAIAHNEIYGEEVL